LEKQLKLPQSHNTFLEEQYRFAQKKPIGARSEDHLGQGKLSNKVAVAEREITKHTGLARNTLRCYHKKDNAE
jgi:hypothetical protein